jgi:pimeloyl-ACP methyl ester carboxylesterase
MKLNYRITGEKGSWLVILHGLFGSSDNWQSLGKIFSEAYKVLLVDQRNHGRSPWDVTHTYDAMADDLKELLDEEGIPVVSLLGHSMGGKTAIRFAQKYPECLNKLIVADIGIKRYPPHHQKVIEAIHSVDLSSVASRKDAEEKVQAIAADRSISGFILKNLYRTEEGNYAWRMNIQALEKNMDNILCELPNEIVQRPTLFLRGDHSAYIDNDDIPGIAELFPNSNIKTISDAGHWLHVDQPSVFSREVISFLG